MLTPAIISEAGCHKNVDENIISIAKIASFDNAAAEKDNNILNIINVGINPKNGHPILWPERVIAIERTSSGLNYYKEMVEKLDRYLKEYKIAPGATIIDWTARTQLVEVLMILGIKSFLYLHASASVRERNERIAQD